MGHTHDLCSPPFPSQIHHISLPWPSRWAVRPVVHVVRYIITVFASHWGPHTNTNTFFKCPVGLSLSFLSIIHYSLAINLLFLVPLFVLMSRLGFRPVRSSSAPSCPLSLKRPLSFFFLSVSSQFSFHFFSILLFSSPSPNTYSSNTQHENHGRIWRTGLDPEGCTKLLNCKW